MALDSEGPIVVLPNPLPGSVEPVRGGIVNARGAELIPDAGNELSQLGAHHPQVQIVGLGYYD